MDISIRLYLEDLAIEIVFQLFTLLCNVVKFLMMVERTGKSST